MTNGMLLLRKGDLGAIHATLTSHRTLCGQLVTYSYQVIVDAEAPVTCPQCNHLLRRAG